MDFTELSAVEMLAMLQQGEYTSREMTEFFLDSIRQQDKDIGAIVRIRADEALAQADAADKFRQSGSTNGLLSGLPIAIKDVLCMEEGVTSCGSRMLMNYHAPYDATVVGRLKRAGAVILGQTNMDEFAMQAYSGRIERRCCCLRRSIHEPSIDWK